MGLFSSGKMDDVTISNSIKNPNELEQLIIADEAYKMSEEELREFCESGGLGEQLVMEGKLKSRTLIRLSKKDDLSRRKKMFCYQLARENKDQAWTKFALFRDKANKEEEKMFKKYGMKAERLAKVSQNQYLHGDPEKKGLLSKFGAEDR